MTAGVLWITGRPAAGKSTLARALADELASRGARATVVDSDEARAAITPEPHYTDEERALFYRALAYAAARLAREGISAIVAATAPSATYRRWARDLCPVWFLVYARCPLAVCEARDPKGLYRRARADEATTLPGTGVPYEEPTDADSVVDTDVPLERAEVRAIADAFLARLAATRPRADTRKSGASLLPYLLLSGGYAALLIGVRKRLWRLQREEQRLSHDADTARETQLATLAPPPPHPWLEIAFRFIPAQAVGGDFYAFFPGGKRLGVILGDVSGKGIPAALASTSISQLARWLRPMEDPDGFLANMNRELLDHLRPETFASMVLAHLDPVAGRLVIYNAGHPPGLLLCGDTLQRIQQANLPLGMFPNVQFVPETFPFRRGDTLVLYSDGFIEARNDAGEELTVEGLEALVRRHAALPPEELASRLVEETRAFGTVTDDLTLVVVQYRPRPA